MRGISTQRCFILCDGCVLLTAFLGGQSHPEMEFRDFSRHLGVGRLQLAAPPLTHALAVGGGPSTSVPTPMFLTMATAAPPSSVQLSSIRAPPEVPAGTVIERSAAPGVGPAEARATHS